MFDDDTVSLVVDNGSGSCRAGFAGEDLPDVVIPAIVGRPRYQRSMHCLYNDQNDKSSYVGSLAQANRGILSLKYPIRKGIITDWDDMQTIWSHIFSDLLKVDTCDHPILLSDAPFAPKVNRKIMAEIMFEHFQCQGFYVSMQPILSLYASGRNGGVLVNSGDGVTHAVTMLEGHAFLPAMHRFNVSGQDLTQYLGTMLTERGHFLNTTAEREIVRDMKEKLCYVSMDFDKEMEDKEQLSAYELPDGHVVTLGKEKFRCAEGLFKPSLVGTESCGLAEIIHKTIMKCPIDVRPQCYCNIIVSGGNTLFPGFVDRLKKEIKILAPPTIRTNVVASVDRINSVWIGGSILASLSTFFNSVIISKSDYQEFGPSIVHKKCL